MQSCNRLLEPFENCLSIFFPLADAKLNTITLKGAILQLYDLLFYMHIYTRYHTLHSLQEGTIKAATIVLREY